MALLAGIVDDGPRAAAEDDLAAPREGSRGEPLCRLVEALPRLALEAGVEALGLLVGLLFVLDRLDDVQQRELAPGLLRELARQGDRGRVLLGEIDRHQDLAEHGGSRLAGSAATRAGRR